MPQLPPDDGRAKAFQEYGRYAGLGFQFAAAILVLGYAGWWLDEKLSTKPLFLIVGVLAGATGGFLSLLKSVPATTAGKRRKSDDASKPR
jgi:F0F1-type ATP synthase assembly protein I